MHRFGDPIRAVVPGGIRLYFTDNTILLPREYRSYCAAGIAGGLRLGVPS
jgi:hypothetical protein